MRFLPASALLCLAAAEAFACSCIPLTRGETIAKADLVAEGMIENTTQQGKESFMPYDATFLITRIIKGEGPERVTVRTSGQSAACGIALAPGATMELALYQRDDGKYNANLCAQMGLKRLAEGGMDQ